NHSEGTGDVLRWGPHHVPRAAERPGGRLRRRCHRRAAAGRGLRRRRPPGRADAAVRGAVRRPDPGGLRPVGDQPGGHLQPGRPASPARLDRPARLGRRGPDPAEGRVAGAGRRAGGDRHPRPQRDEGLLPAAAGDRRGHRRPGLVPHRRHRGQGRRRVLLRGGPQEGHDHQGRLQRLPARARGGPAHPPGGEPGRSRRRAASQPRRGGQGVRGPRRRFRPHRGGPGRLVQAEHGRLQVPAHRRVPRPAPDDCHRKDTQARTRSFRGFCYPGRSTAVSRPATPARGDLRFADPAWQENPFYRRLGQAYLAMEKAVTSAVERADLDEPAREKARLAAAVLVSALAPVNTLPGNPAALKRAFDTGGLSLARGARNLLADVRAGRLTPRPVDTRPFTLGETLGVTPGAGVFRNEVVVIIQYAPSTPEVRAVPLLIVWSLINRYYVLDLAPGRSFIEYAVSQGFRVFVTSWRNPGRAQSGWDLDTYAAALLEATDAVAEISGSGQIG